MRPPAFKHCHLKRDLFLSPLPPPISARAPKEIDKPIDPGNPLGSDGADDDLDVSVLIFTKSYSSYVPNKRAPRKLIFRNFSTTLRPYWGPCPPPPPPPPPTPPPPRL